MVRKCITIVVIVFFSLIIVFFSLKKRESNNYQKRGGSLIEKIEIFKQTENKLPRNVNEMGLDESMNDGPYYEKIDSVNYIVFFNIGFDDILIYHSDKKKWGKQ